MGLRFKTPKEGRYDYDGACKPGQASCANFSVGIFLWESRTNKDGTKRLVRSKSVGRVRGPSSRAEDVYRMAEDICDRIERFELIVVHGRLRPFTSEVK